MATVSIVNYSNKKENVRASLNNNSYEITICQLGGIQLQGPIIKPFSPMLIKDFNGNLFKPCQLTMYDSVSGKYSLAASLVGTIDKIWVEVVNDVQYVKTRLTPVKSGGGIVLREQLHQNEHITFGCRVNETEGAAVEIIGIDLCH